MPCAHKKCIHGRDKRYCKLGCKDLILPRKPRSPKADQRFPNVAGGIAKPQHSKVPITSSLPTSKFSAPSSRENPIPQTNEKVAQIDANSNHPNSAPNIHTTALESVVHIKDFNKPSSWKGDAKPAIEKPNPENNRNGFQSDPSLQNKTLISSAFSSFARIDQSVVAGIDIATGNAASGAQFSQHQDPIAPRILKLRSTTKELTNICCVKPTPSFEMLRPAIPILADIIKTAQDEQVLVQLLFFWRIS